MKTATARKDNGDPGFASNGMSKWSRMQASGSRPDVKKRRSAGELIHFHTEKLEEMQKKLRTLVGAPRQLLWHHMVIKQKFIAKLERERESLFSGGE